MARFLLDVNGYIRLNIVQMDIWNRKIVRYKARLVVKGYIQMEGIDYFDTFSPASKLTTIRVPISLAAIKGWHLEQLDVNKLFYMVTSTRRPI